MKKVFIIIFILINYLVLAEDKITKIENREEISIEKSKEKKRKENNVIYSLGYISKNYNGKDIKKVAGGIFSGKKVENNSVSEISIILCGYEFDKKFKYINEITDTSFVGLEAKEKVVFFRIGENIKMNCGTGISFNWIGWEYQKNLYNKENKIYEGTLSYSILGVAGIEYRKKKDFYINSELLSEYMIADNNRNIINSDKIVNNHFGIGYRVEIGYYFY